MSDELMTQCKLKLPNGGMQVAWIPKYAARPGRSVELKEDGLFWTVVETYGTMPKSSIKQGKLR